MRHGLDTNRMLTRSAIKEDRDHVNVMSSNLAVSEEQAICTSSESIYGLPGGKLMVMLAGSLDSARSAREDQFELSYSHLPFRVRVFCHVSLQVHTCPHAGNRLARRYMDVLKRQHSTECDMHRHAASSIPSSQTRPLRLPLYGYGGEVGQFDCAKTGPVN